MTSIPADRWKNFWLGRQRPTVEMIEAVCREHPQFAFWLTTGCTLGNGHAAPGLNGYPTKSPASKASADYLKLAIKSREEALEAVRNWSSGEDKVDDETLRVMSTLLPEEMAANLIKIRTDEQNAKLIYIAECLVELDIPSIADQDGRWKTGIWKNLSQTNQASWRDMLPVVRALLQEAHQNARNADQMLNIMAVEREIEEKLQAG